MSEERRAYQRRKIYVTCRFEGRDHLAAARIIDASEDGIAILIPEEGECVSGDARVHIPPAHQLSEDAPEAIALSAHVVDVQKKTKGHRVGLKILKVETGEEEWTHLCHAFR